MHANTHKGSLHISFSLPFTKQLFSIFLKLLSDFYIFIASCYSLIKGVSNPPQNSMFSASWLAPHGLLRLLSNRTRPTSPGRALLTINWALTHPSVIKKMSYRLDYSPIL